MAKPVIDETAVSSVETGIIVRNIEAMVRFYIDMLGFEPYGETKLDFVHVRGFRLGNTILKLTYFYEPVDAPQVEGFAPGMRYLTLRVSNIGEAYASLIAAGFEPWLELETATTTRGVVYQHCGVFDPDRNFVELVQGESYSPPSPAFARGEVE
ncbi:MAG: VOC family protein [Sphingobium phenoxybenzoativorans]|uniref:VOC family protein n=1 Tax=Sphingobium phenoxybenzoativorans TaxID=1592790 RepID=UPI000872B67E|nr:VOC family protein [Sphingobium phenoxybenzoativorans]